MEIKKVACVGAGLIGQGWATVFAVKGREVILQDLEESLLELSLEKIAANLNFLEVNGLVGAGEAESAIKRITVTTAIDTAVGQTDYVQESVPDDYELKKSVFKKMDAAAAQDAILASSASGLLMTEIQQVVSRPQRCILVHPFLPVHLIPCVEIVGGKETSKATLEITETFMRKMGKHPVLLKHEIPGYIVNRLQAALLREAIDLIYKGVASAEDIDRAFRMGMGLRDPFLGPLLRAHLAGNGIDQFIQNYGRSYQNRWESMESWTSIPPAAAKSLRASVHAMDMVRTKTLEEIKQWRDEMLVNILKVVQED